MWKTFLSKNVHLSLKAHQKNFFQNTAIKNFSTNLFQNKNLKSNSMNFFNFRSFFTNNQNQKFSQQTAVKQSLPKFSLFALSVKYMRSAKTRLKLKYPNKNYKMKTKKGLAKRITIVGGIGNKAFKFKSPGARHKMLNKTRANKA